MNHLPRAIAIILIAAVFVLTLAACASDGNYYGRTTVSTGYYSGPGWYDPYYGRPYYGNTTVIVRPGYGNRPGHRPGGRPPGAGPPGGRPPGARPPGGGRPTQLPSRPRPRPARR